MLGLASGVYRYRFIVDGERRFQPDRPREADIMGTISNLIDVHVSIFFSFNFFPRCTYDCLCELDQQNLLLTMII